MTFVLDASVAVSWCFAYEASARSLHVRSMLEEQRAVVPPLWTYELANALAVAVRRNRLSVETAAEMIDRFGDLPIDISEVPRAASELLRVAREHEVTAYDAAYLHLAMSRGVPLATFDERLATASRAAGVPVIDG